MHRGFLKASPQCSHYGYRGIKRRCLHAKMAYRCITRRCASTQGYQNIDQFTTAASCYGKNWRLFVLYGYQDNTPNCGELVFEFIKEFKTFAHARRSHFRTRSSLSLSHTLVALTFAHARRSYCQTHSQSSMYRIYLLPFSYLLFLKR